mgnify:CR=1 FL=1
MTNLLVLGGTAWLGREVATQARDLGIDVTCLARGAAGDAPDGVRFVPADRSVADAYVEVQDGEWDAVVDVSWQPDLVASAVRTLGERAAHWTYVSSCSVYAVDDVPGQVVSAPRLLPLDPSGPATGETYASAKVSCEVVVGVGGGMRAVLARAGLIGGPGDTSDRVGYWPARFALAGDGPVLVPDSPNLSTQTIDVRDLAAWIVAAPRLGAVGPVNAMGEPTLLPAALTLSAEAAGFTGTAVAASPAWLVEQGVEPWAGPRSLPLWLPLPEYAGFAARSDRRALEVGLVRRPLSETLADTLADERSRGLDRPRRAGLTRAEELELIALLTA